MKIISLKLEDKILSEVDERLVKNRYSTRTEFIRDAIREKLVQLEQDEVLRDIAKLSKIDAGKKLRMLAHRFSIPKTRPDDEFSLSRSSKTKEEAIELLKKQGRK